MANYLNIPKEIIIGKKNNQGFVTYKQGSKLAKEISFKNWLGNGEQINTTNSPIKGFILQDCVGGHGGSWYSYERRAWAIVKDPRGFNIEITFDNLVWIMKMVSHDHNTGFNGEFVYGWDGAQLMLVPVISEDYRYTINIDSKETYKLKDLNIGDTYRFPNEHNMIYLGYLPIIKLKDKYMNGYDCNVEYVTKKFHCFYCPYDSYEKFITLSSTKKKIIKDVDKPTQTKEWLDKKIKEMNDYLWNNDKIEDISNINRLIPNPKKTHNKIEKLIAWCQLPYTEKKDKYGYIQNNLSDNNWSGIGNSSILLFDDANKSITEYFLHGTLLLDNKEESKWINEKIDIELRNVPLSVQWAKREELKIKFKKEFRDNAKRIICAYRSKTWQIENNKIMITDHDDLTHNIIVDAVELLSEHKDSISLTSHYTDSYFDMFLVETNEGFVFQVNK